MTSPKVQYAYANGSANHIRPTLLTYPSGRELNYNYGSADSLPDAASRLAALLDDDGSTHLADYSYLGRGMFIETDYAQPEVKYTLVGTAGGDDPDTGDIYRGLDRFGRIKDSYWRDYGSSADVDRIKYGYDRNGNRTYRENPVATANSASFDEKYFHDLLDRLKHMDRGRLNGQKDAVTDKTFAQCWSLDSTGNWRKFTEDSDGDGVWDLDQLRTANRVNEITDLSEYTGPAWVTPAYNRAGNMTTIPKPADPTGAFTATYDAWNRLVKLEDGSGTVAQYEYDGAKRRTVRKSYTGGTLSETRHFYYTEPESWQVIEERVESETDPDRQFVWGQRYIDDLVLRDRDTNADGDLDERLYGMQDANWNVTGIVNSSGDVQERYSYSAYGQSTVLTPAFVHRDYSLFEWETNYSSYRRDGHSELAYVRHRWLHPRFGSWTTRDPMALVPYQPSDANDDMVDIFERSSAVNAAWLASFIGFEFGALYRYTNDNPLTLTDAFGLFVCLPHHWSECAARCARHTPPPGRTPYKVTGCTYTVSTITIGVRTWITEYVICKCTCKRVMKCSAKVRASLDAVISKVCKTPGVRGEACVPGMSRAEALTNAMRFQACAAARREIINKCYGGRGDSGHEEAYDNAFRAAWHCLEIAGYGASSGTVG